MEFFYQNCIGEKLDFTKFPYLVKSADNLLNCGWGYTVANNRIENFSKSVAEIPIEINIYAEMEEEFREVANHFFEVIEKDILKNKKGKLVYNGQYLRGFIKENNKEDWCKGIPFYIAKVMFVTDSEGWIAEKTYNFQTFNVSSTKNKRYPGKYPHRYANGLSGSYLINEHFMDTNFLLRIYGPVVNPQVFIGEYPYLVYTILDEGEYLEINSRDQTVVKYTQSGEQVNLYHNRAKRKSIFRKIPPGRQSVSWTGKFPMDIVLYEERSEPKW